MRHAAAERRPLSTSQGGNPRQGAARQDDVRATACGTISRGSGGTFKSKPKPPGLDWDRFLGPAPKRPFEWMRYDSWRLFRDYGGGQLSDILTHWVDVAQWFMNEPRPIDAVATGGIYQLNDGRENPDTVIGRSALCEGLEFQFRVHAVAGPRRQAARHLLRHRRVLSRSARTNYIFGQTRKHAVEVKATENLDAAHATNWLDAIAGSAADQRRHRRRPKRLRRRPPRPGRLLDAANASVTTRTGGC